MLLINDYDPIIEKGIDPQQPLFKKESRQNEDVAELSCGISCFVKSIFCLCLPFTCCCMTKKVKPMHDTIVSECGIVTKILRIPGPYCLGFCCVETSDIYMGLNTTEIKGMGANDFHGSPIVVSAQFVHRIVDSLNANYKTSNLSKFLTDQAESALRAVLAQYPYNRDDGHADCLTKQSDKIDTHLVKTFQALVDFVGVKVESFRLINVSYEQRMEKLLLAKQEAQAEVTARKTIAEGTTGIIQETLVRLKTLGIELTPTQLNKFVTNLSLILVNHGHTTLNIFDSDPKQ